MRRGKFNILLCVIPVRFIIDEEYAEADARRETQILVLRRQVSKLSNSNKRTLGIGKEY